MRVLLDHNLPRRLRGLLPGHDVKTAREMRWDTLKNGALLDSAARAGFNAVLSMDKNLRHEQNLDQLPLPVIVLDCASNALPALIPIAPHLMSLLSAPLMDGLYIISPDGTIERLGNAAAP